MHDDEKEVEGLPRHGALAYLLPSDVDPVSVRKATNRYTTEESSAEIFARGSSQLIVFGSDMENRARSLHVERDDGQPLVLQLPD